MARESILLDPAEVIMFDVVGRITNMNRFGERFIICKLSPEKAAECEEAGLSTFMLKPRPDSDDEPSPGIRIKIAYPNNANLSEEFRAKITPKIMVRCEGVNTQFDEDMSYRLGEFAWDRVALAIRPRYIKLTNSVKAELDWLVIDTHKSEAERAREKYGFGVLNQPEPIVAESEGMPFE